MWAVVLMGWLLLPFRRAGALVPAVQSTVGSPSVRSFTRSTVCYNLRQHANPLSSFLQQPIELSDTWVEDQFEDPTLPFHIDLGCAKGRFCIALGEREAGALNVLGLELRGPAVDIANRHLERSGAKNVGFLASNVNVDLERILGDIRRHSSVQRIAVQFPDPMFKKRHRKRRIVQPALVDMIARHTDPGTEIFLQTDVFDVAEEMRLFFRSHPGFCDTHEDLSDWMSHFNPIDLPTEREVGVKSRSMPVYRSVLHRVPFDEASLPVSEWVEEVSDGTLRSVPQSERTLVVSPNSKYLLKTRAGSESE